MDMSKNFRTNIINLYLIKFFKWFNLVMPIVVIFGVAALAIPAALFLVEPEIHARKLATSFKAILQTVHQTFSHKTLCSALLVSSFTGTASLTFAWFVQPYFQEAGLPLYLFGVMWTLLNLSVGLSSMFSFWFEHGFTGGRCKLFTGCICCFRAVTQRKMILDSGYLMLDIRYRSKNSEIN